VTVDPLLQRSVALEYVDNPGAPEQVTHRDTAEASSKGNRDGGPERELSAVDRDSGEDEDGFVRNERAYDAEHEQPEDGEVAVVRDELIDMGHAYRLRGDQPGAGFGTFLVNGRQSGVWIRGTRNLPPDDDITCAIANGLARRGNSLLIAG
jgi:hypothetical protein